MPGHVIRAAEELRELPVDPIWVGIGTLVILVALLTATFIFGKGRPHA
jgi:hypothetical protein